MKHFLVFFLILVGFTGTAFAQSADNVDEGKSGIIVATTSNTMYNIPYSITSGTVDGVTPDCDSASAIFLFTSDKTGKLVLDIPRNLLDPKYKDADEEFFVLLDGDEVEFEETSSSQSREITVLFGPGSHELEIISTGLLSPHIESLSCKVAHDPPHSYILSPLKQAKSGISPDEIQCRESLVLMIKDDNYPACVTQSTASALSDRGWGHVLDVEDLHSSTVTVQELCAAEFDKIRDSVKSSCGLPESDVVCSPPTLMESLMNAKKEHTSRFAENNCARTTDEWNDLSHHRSAFGGSEVDWDLLADIYDENPAYDIYGLDEKFQPNKVGQKIRMTISYWDTVSCFDYAVRVIDKITGDAIYDRLYSYDCKPGQTGQYGKMNLRLFGESDFEISLPGRYLLDVSGDVLNLSEEFFVECTSGGCEFLTDGQMEGRKTYGDG